IWFALRMIEVRLRFVAVLVGLGLIIGYWDTIRNYWDRWTRPAVATASNVASDTEFYCPMDPSVVRPGLEPNGSVPKCPICGMPLSLRKKGAPVELPPGVVGRVTLSPSRVRMAGIRTSEIGLRPMRRTIRTVGVVAYDESRRSQIVTRVSGYIEKLLVDTTFVQVNAGDPLAEIYSPELFAAIQELKVASGLRGSNLAKLAREKIRLLGIDDAEIDAMLRAGDDQYRVVVRSPSSGFVIQKLVQQGSTISAGQMLFEVADTASVWIEADVYERDLAMLAVGQEVQATVEAYPSRVFTGRVSLIYPELNATTRTGRVRFEVDNAERLLRARMYATVELTTPVQETEPFQSILASTKSAPADPEEAIALQSVCPVTGQKLGSMGKPLPVKAAGQTVYLCCAGCRNSIERDPQKYIARIRTVSDDGVLAVPESAVIDTGDQKIVYVERDEGVYEGVEVQLGPKSDGYYAVVSGLLPDDRVAAAGAFLIDAETRLNPAASASYFGASGGASSDGNSGVAAESESAVPEVTMPEVTMPEMDAEAKEPALDFATSRLTSEQLAQIAKLPPDDQTLAKQQVLCPVTKEPLGSMGKPLKVSIDGDSVFVCCKGCVKAAEANAAETLEQVRRWREANAKPAAERR
ncbi:MAG: efflux RND transporter periplasmic adaptor subunit, partial [Aureliella sp.]